MKENPRLVEFDGIVLRPVLETPHQMLRESQQNTHKFRLFATLTRGRRLSLLVVSTFPRFHAQLSTAESANALLQSLIRFDFHPRSQGTAANSAALPPISARRTAGIPVF